jgi:hypothetical protein
MSDSESSEKKVTMEQLNEHKTQGDLWLLVDGKGELVRVTQRSAVVAERDADAHLLIVLSSIQPIQFCR